METIDINDCGYGQYVDLDFNETTNSFVNFEQEHYNEYNVQLDTYEHMLEYGPNVYIQENMVTSLAAFNTSLFTNPIVHMITGVLNWWLK